MGNLSIFNLRIVSTEKKKNEKEMEEEKKILGQIVKNLYISTSLEQKKLNDNV